MNIFQWCASLFEDDTPEVKNRRKLARAAELSREIAGHRAFLEATKRSLYCYPTVNEELAQKEHELSVLLGVTCPACGAVRK